MTDTPVRYADDPDASITWPVTDAGGENIDFPPTCALDSGDYTVTGTWLDPAGPTRRIQVPLVGVDLQGRAGRSITVYLQVPGGSDIRLGTVYVTSRA